ncbi:hypothetical protein PIB30_086226 [Stylosanthes scabra]|uniref:Uncharacterized protein n=1 Tax=Stylosanthes scabra TaxID=79078 RepID=A0ABU6RU07_9FABA|nr:hypothetical protein [Stylosanthes scabra]
MEQANYMGNVPRPPYNDPYWKASNPGNQGQKYYNINFQKQQAPPMQPNTSQKPFELEIALQKLSQSTSAFVDQTQIFMQETRANFKNQEASIRNLEVQVSQIAKELSERPPNTLPSNTIPNPKEECKAIKLRSQRQVIEELEESAEGSHQIQQQEDATPPQASRKRSGEISRERDA